MKTTQALWPLILLIGWPVLIAVIGPASWDLLPYRTADGPKYTCSIEEQVYDKSHRMILGLPPGECVRPGGKPYATRTEAWLAAVKEQEWRNTHDGNPCPDVVCGE